MRSTSLVVGALVLFAAFGAAAQDTMPSNIRGKIEKIDGNTLTVKSRDGKTLAITMSDGFVVLGVVKEQLSDIKENDFIGTAALEHKDGKLHAQEIVIFPDAMRGTGEGHYPWDLRGKKDTMTNGTVTQVAGAATGAPKGETLSIKDKDGEQQVMVSPTTPVVTFQPGDPALLKPGAAIFLRAPKQADGTIVAKAVIVEQNGIKPPM
jgi:hypothetical protein